MPKHIATIVLTDEGDDEVHVKCTFGVEGEPGGATDDSAAHRTAMAMMAHAVGGVAEHRDD